MPSSENNQAIIDRLQRLSFSNHETGNMLVKFRKSSYFFIESVLNPIYNSTQPMYTSPKTSEELIIDTVIGKIVNKHLASQEMGILETANTVELRESLRDTVGGSFFEQLIRSECAELEMPGTNIKPENFGLIMLETCEKILDPKVVQEIKNNYIPLTFEYNVKPDFDPIETFYKALRNTGNRLFKDGFHSNLEEAEKIH